MEILRSCWEIPSIAHFCSVFKAAFHLFDFDVEELELGLLSHQYSSFLVPSIIKKLLQGCLDTDVTSDNWETCLWEILQDRWVEEEGRTHPFPNRFCSFSSLPLQTKVEVLHSLCMYRLDSDDITDILKGIDSNMLRIDPVGRDSQGNTYWYFSGLRLYKEECGRNSKWKKGDEKKRSWSIVCTTQNDWHNFANALGKSRGNVDKALHKTITNEFLPRLQEIITEQERITRRRMLESAPRRSSSRIEFKQKKKEKEEHLAAILAAEEERKRQENEERQRIKEEKERKAREKRERAKRAEERLKAIEERANRAKIRKQNVESRNESKTSSDDSEEDIVSVGSEQEVYSNKRGSICLKSPFSHILITNGSSKRQKAQSYGYSSDEESTDDSVHNGSYAMKTLNLPVVPLMPAWLTVKSLMAKLWSTKARKCYVFSILCIAVQVSIKFIGVKIYHGKYIAPTWSYVKDGKNSSNKHTKNQDIKSNSGIFVSHFYSRAFMENQS